VERGEWKEECGEPEVRRPRTERPSAMKQCSVSDGEEESGEWKEESGKWRVERGKWKVESGEWRVESGKTYK